MRGPFNSAPIASGLEGVTNAAALRLFESDRFETVWENVNRRAHSAVVDVAHLRGRVLRGDEARRPHPAQRPEHHEHGEQRQGGPQPAAR